MGCMTPLTISPSRPSNQPWRSTARGCTSRSACMPSIARTTRRSLAPSRRRSMINAGSHSSAPSKPAVERAYAMNDHGAATALATLLADPLNVQGIYSDGDDGRLPAEVPAGMDGAFRTPSLRCVSTRPSFMHTGHLHALADVVAFFVR